MKNRTRLFTSLAAVAVLVAGLLVQQGDVGAASLTSKITVLVSATLSNVLDLGSTVQAPLVSQPTQSFANGVGANQANVLWFDTRTLAPSTTDSLDFAAGGLVDAFGATVAPAKVRGVIITAATANTQNITLFGDAAQIPLQTACTTGTSTVILQPGGIFVFTAPATAGVAVTATTADIIKIANGAGTSVTYSIVLIGTSS